MQDKLILRTNLESMVSPKSDFRFGKLDPRPTDAFLSSYRMKPSRDSLV